MIRTSTGYTATLLRDGRVLFAGGYLDKSATAASQVYDPKSGKFTATGSMTVARWNQTATLLTDGRVLMAGGESGAGTEAADPALASAELYDPATGTFSRTGSLATARISHVAALLHDGRVLVAGGQSGGADYHDLASAELFDPATGKFSPTGSMSDTRFGCSSTVLLDGRVLVAGGSTETAELYDPGSGVFTRTGSLTTARDGASAILLADGRVLIVGGISNDSEDLLTAELYQP
jgi:hypothetical protein